MVLHYESENDDYSTMIPVPLERYEHLLMVESLYDRIVDELLTDISVDKSTFYFRHQILMKLGQTEEALKMKRKEKEFESNLKKTVSEELQRM